MKPAKSKDTLSEPIEARHNSTTAFKRKALRQKDIKRLFMAATKVPSYNDSPPWKFYASSTDRFDLFLSFINMESLSWANSASMIVIITASKSDGEQTYQNKHRLFECGAAWSAITRQACRMKLHTHMITDINEQRIIEQLSIPDSDQIVCAVAIGVIDKSVEETTPSFTPPELESILTIC